MVWIKQAISIAVLLVLAAATWLWLTMLSPWLYSPPDDGQTVEQRTHQLFVYGTLRYAAIRWIVFGGSGNPEAAVLEGYERDGLNLTPQPESHVDGLKLTVTHQELARLDRYERLGIRYERIEKQLADGSSAWVYVRLSEFSHLLTSPPARQIALIP
ncbi:gamma-glutamylcyclotransferase family protein [Vreelandella zhanjiangensis]|uniref:gamma-glutamylcyclotransferase family protein n=1 Tax=Vreelandella zhanjiangensis TaxID=1121960 RepID=UPI00402A69E8